MKRKRYCVVALLVCAMACTRAVYVDDSAVMPDIPGSIMGDAIEDWPEDTSGGLYAVGQSIPMEDSTNRIDLENMAEHGALSRIFGMLRMRGIGTNATEQAFLICMEQQNKNAFIQKRQLPNGRFEVGVFIKEEHLQSLNDCLGDK